MDFELFYSLCVCDEEKLHKLSICNQAVLQQCEEVTNYSDRIPFYNMMFSNKIPPSAVCHFYVFGVVCVLFIEKIEIHG